MARRLQALLLDRVAAFPADLPRLYRLAFDHGAALPGFGPCFPGPDRRRRRRMAGERPARVLPGLAGETWDDLRFAYLRRLFRGQIRPRGALEQWDVAHGQMREAILDWLTDAARRNRPARGASAASDGPAGGRSAARDLNHAPPAGPEPIGRAATYYAIPVLLDAAAAGATSFLADAWTADRRQRRSAPSSPICSPYPICRAHGSVRKPAAVRYARRDRLRGAASVGPRPAFS